MRILWHSNNPSGRWMPTRYGSMTPDDIAAHLRALEARLPDEADGQACGICGHEDRHAPHSDGTGWPSTILKCAACPDGKCALPDADT